MTTEHKERMAAKKAERAAREPGFESIMPAAKDAKGWLNLNRAHRRAAIARSQAARNGKPRLKTHAAKVAYQRGVEKFGVCPTRPRPCDLEVANGAS